MKKRYNQYKTLSIPRIITSVIALVLILVIIGLTVFFVKGAKPSIPPVIDNGGENGGENGGKNDGSGFDNQPFIVAFFDRIGYADNLYQKDGIRWYMEDVPTDWSMYSMYPDRENCWITGADGNKQPCKMSVSGDYTALGTALQKIYEYGLTKDTELMLQADDSRPYRYSLVNKFKSRSGFFFGTMKCRLEYKSYYSRLGDDDGTAHFNKYPYFDGYNGVSRGASLKSALGSFYDAEGNLGEPQDMRDFLLSKDRILELPCYIEWLDESGVMLKVLYRGELGDFVAAVEEEYYYERYVTESGVVSYKRRGIKNINLGDRLRNRDSYDWCYQYFNYNFLSGGSFCVNDFQFPNYRWLSNIYSLNVNFTF